MLDGWKRFFQKRELRYDVAIVSDFRFPGGTSASNAREIRIQHDAGLKTALFHAPSAVIDRRRNTFNPLVQECLDNGYADLLNSNSRAYAPITIVRHPTVANTKRHLPKTLRTDHVVLVINHPARSHRKVDYEIAEVVENIRDVFGVIADARPNSPIVGNACVGPRSKHISLGEYWHNIFDVPPAIASRSTANTITIGRHSRDGPEKWPADAELIGEAYPSVDDVKVRVLGGAETPRRILGKLPGNWTVLGFNEITVTEFLNSIDVYVYFHHASWTEAFSRAVSEAIISGIPTILPRSFEPLFADACLYCEPSEVLDLVRRLKNEPEWRAEIGRNGRRMMIERFAPDQHLRRLQQLGIMIPATREITPTA